MARKKKVVVPILGIDPKKVEDMQKLADDLKELDSQELAYISGAVQMARMMGGIRKKNAKHAAPDSRTA